MKLTLNRKNRKSQKSEIGAIRFYGLRLKKSLVEQSEWFYLPIILGLILPTYLII